MTPKKIASPLSRKATLVAVDISQWTARKLDKRVTDKVNREHHASDDAGRYQQAADRSEAARSDQLAASPRRARCTTP